MNKDKNYCRICGGIIKSKEVDMDYNPLTGKPRYNLLWKCRNKKWWNFHDKYKSDEEGSTYAFES